jgi:hypothetical protein
MWGLLENARESFLIENISLEAGWQLWLAGSLRVVSAMSIAARNECECGNAAGTNCFNSTHAQIREMMAKGWKPNGETMHVGDIYDEFRREEKQRELLELSTDRAGAVIADGKKDDISG